MWRCDSATDLRAALVDWLKVYHHERPHQALGWKTPTEKRAEHLSLRSAEAA